MVVPPVMLIQVEDAMDVMIARNTARRAASLLGFASASRAQIATAVAALVDIIVGVGTSQIVHMHGIRNGMEIGIQVSCEAPWLASASPDDALLALHTKLGDTVDELKLEPGPPPRIILILWLSPERTAQHGT